MLGALWRNVIKQARKLRVLICCAHRRPAQRTGMSEPAIKWAMAAGLVLALMADSFYVAWARLANSYGKQLAAQSAGYQADLTAISNAGAARRQRGARYPQRRSLGNAGTVKLSGEGGQAIFDLRADRHRERLTLKAQDYVAAACR